MFLLLAVALCNFTALYNTHNDNNTGYFYFDPRTAAISDGCDIPSADEYIRALPVNCTGVHCGGGVSWANSRYSLGKIVSTHDAIWANLVMSYMNWSVEVHALTLECEIRERIHVYGIVFDSAMIAIDDCRMKKERNDFALILFVCICISALMFSVGCIALFIRHRMYVRRFNARYLHISGEDEKNHLRERYGITDA